MVIPAYNEENTLPLLRAVLESWLPRQPWTIDAIIVDDGSNDGTNLLLHQWAGEAAWLFYSNSVRYWKKIGEETPVTLKWWRPLAWMDQRILLRLPAMRWLT